MIRRKVRWCLGTAVAVLFTVLPYLHEPQAWGAERVKLAIPSKSMGYLPLYVAIHRGFLRDEGIEIEIPILLPHIAHNALMGGEIDYHGVADSALRLAARGAPIKGIFFSARRPMYFLMAKPEFKSVADLRGKKIAISSFGGTTDFGARVALRHYGVEPEKDVLLVMIGLETTRFAALAAGSVEASVHTVPNNVLLRQKGFREMVFLGDVIEFPSNGFTTTDRRIKENRDQVKRMLRALYRGLLFARQRPKETIEVIEREWKVERDVAQESYNSIAKALSSDGTASEAGLNVHFQLIQKMEQGLGTIPMAKVVDFKPLEEVRPAVTGF
jgi:NitT/TauT family transport system substrate-binding protein